mmetsp:Transcript_2374/g.5905  ORF Transcript_2374/g.5905 Transcript_2374/m.5905 type:complete len:205 (-) Transcript_2374:378-992(-)
MTDGAGRGWMPWFGGGGGSGRRWFHPSIMIGRRCRCIRSRPTNVRKGRPMRLWMLLLLYGDHCSHGRIVGMVVVMGVVVESLWWTEKGGRCRRHHFLLVGAPLLLLFCQGDEGIVLLLLLLWIRKRGGNGQDSIRVRCGPDAVRRRRLVRAGHDGSRVVPCGGRRQQSLPIQSILFFLHQQIAQIVVDDAPRHGTAHRHPRRRR